MGKSPAPMLTARALAIAKGGIAAPQSTNAATPEDAAAGEVAAAAAGA